MIFVIVYSVIPDQCEYIIDDEEGNVKYYVGKSIAGFSYLRLYLLFDLNALEDFFLFLCCILGSNPLKL